METETTETVETAETEKTGQEPSQEELDNLIRNHVYASMGVGLVPIPLADFLALTGIQINLLRKLAKTYDVPFSKDTVKNILFSLVGGALPTVASVPLAVSVAKAVPFIGQTAGIVTMPIVAGAATYAIGKVFVRHFASGGTFLTFNPEKVKDYYTEMFKKGEEVASDIKEKREAKKQDGKAPENS